MTAICVNCGAEVGLDEAGRWIDEGAQGLDDPATRCAPDGELHEVAS